MSEPEPIRIRADDIQLDDDDFIDHSADLAAADGDGLSNDGEDAVDSNDDDGPSSTQEVAAKQQETNTRWAQQLVVFSCDPYTVF